MIAMEVVNVMRFAEGMALGCLRELDVIQARLSCSAEQG